MHPHRFDIVSLIFGMLFATVGAIFFTGDVDPWRWNWSWFWPAALTLSGVMVLASLRPRNRHDDGTDT